MQQDSALESKEGQQKIEDWSTSAMPSLVDILRAELSPSIQEQDITQLRYVLYARKSTTGDERQERSLEDQIADCLENQVQKFSLNIVGTVQEKESAKEPDIRPLFRQMIEDIKRGKYDAILTWHPDRLSRNMKDAGEVIDLLEKNIIKDLRFATFQFENSPMGKMLLGMSFVLSKQYTDHLSETVTRAHRRMVNEAMYPNKPKHGYLKDINQRHRPDGNNWILIKQAFQMRFDGHTELEIAKFLNDHGYTRAPTQNTERKPTYKMDPKRISEMLRDPFYAGVLVFGNEIVDLTKLYDFVPMISEEEFMKLNKISSLNKNIRLARAAFSGQVQANLLRRMVICSKCNNAMSTGITVKPEKKEKRFFYRCNSTKCPIKGKSLPARVVISFIYDFLDQYHFNTKKNYEHYVAEMEQLSVMKANNLIANLASLQQAKKERVKTYDRTKGLLRSDDPIILKHYTGDLEKISQEITDFDEKIKETNKLINNSKSLILSYEEFIELFGNISVRLRKTMSMELKDKIIRKFFSNLTLNAKQISIRKDGKPVLEWSVVNYELNEPFKTFIKHNEFSSGGPDRIRTGDLLRDRETC